MNVCSQHSAMRIIIPSPLAGEGSTEGRLELTRERGSHTRRRHLWRPHTPQPDAQAPSPAQRGFATLGGEGTIASSVAEAIA
jgi:hypothetical protein